MIKTKRQKHKPLR